MKLLSAAIASVTLVGALALQACSTTDVALPQKVTVTHSALTGIGVEAGVMRRDPSDVIKVDNIYYVWYSKGKISTGYDATVWYATSADGHNWVEQGEALAKGKKEAGKVKAYSRPISLLQKVSTGFLYRYV
ncbi:hypothetical protein [Psychrosphaera algicola]|uniref:Uncharacterized protein n=1 Tax=Psychrosphaera algicola TaxID=3023714 RepID=A0ABT5FBA3_9GAMM|nr:hypothetical protein [Psychrosphaera sp. G1-22]MDC2888820.1 hypothetical protein [Psychrosphaera sp. G1-22]